jgi:spermidine synthase
MVLFFCSGLVGLAYEVVWVRSLGLVVGNALWSAIAVVAAYMGGMALGSWLVARLAARLRRHLRVWAVAEAIVAVTALATPQAMVWLSRLAAHLGPEPLGNWGIPLAGRFAIAWLFLAVPTVAMGMTLPLLVARVGEGETLGGLVARLYAANTAGAVAGVVLAGFVALPNLGERGTLALAAIIGLVVAAVAWRADGFVPRAPAVVAQPPDVDRSRGWLLAATVTGFVALACELVWTRILLLHLGSRVYAFSLVLAVYLLGVAVGSALARRLRCEPRAALAACQVALGAVLAGQVLLFARFGDVLACLTSRLHPVGFVGLELTLALGTAVVLLPPTLAFGASFPFLVGSFRSRAKAEVRTGLVAAANTVGGIAGAVVAPLLLVPWLGSQNVLLLFGALSVCLGAVLAAGLATRVVAVVTAAFLAAVTVSTPRAAVLAGAAAVSEGKLEALSESASATVVVRVMSDARGRWRSLELNGVNVAGTSPELRAIQRLQGHLPLLLHPSPASVLHLGFGSGGTAWAVAQHPVRSITIAEISPEVAAVSDRVFGEINHGVLHDPRVRLVLNDGRNVLLASQTQFDVILSDSIHPVFAGNSTLYTREYFALCRSHLRPGGVVSMWLPMYSLTEESFLGILRAFADIFPTTCVWYDPVVLNEFTVVTGSVGAGTVQLRWGALFDPALGATLAEAGVNGPVSLARMLLLGPHDVARLVTDVLPHVDDFPEVEYRSGRVVDRDGSWLANFRMLWAFRTRANPFARFPGNWAATVASRDEVVKTQLRVLARRVAVR